jgi:enoyl-CoA hydratase
MNSSSVLLFEKQGHVGIITLNRAADMNAVNKELADALQSCVQTQIEGDSEVWVGVLRSSNAKVFCAGADLKSVSRGDSLLTPDGGFAGYVSLKRTKPIIACVDGMALAGGFEICLASDLIVCSTASKFGLPEVKRSLVAMAGGTYRLPKRILRNVAMDLLLTGEPITAERAFQLGLVSRLAEPGQSFAVAMKLAGVICENAPLAVVATRELVLEASEGNKSENELRENAEASMLFLMQTEDFAEGPRAFIEKRAPRWTGKMKKAKL